MALALRLFERERWAGDLDVFSGAAASYAAVLGQRGLAEYRRLADAEWQRLPQLRSGDKRTFDGRRFRITHIMETLADADGDVDAAVAVLAKDQSSPYQFVRIAERLRDAGRFGDALAWAEKGLALFGPRADPRLVDVAAEEYHRAGRGKAAVKLAWRAYEPDPTPREYQRLCGQARKADLWKDWRERAFAALRGKVTARIRDAAKPAGRGARPVPHWLPQPDASDLVSVLLFEQDVEQAWAEAQAGGCNHQVWLQLARRREGEHPLDAIPIWQAEVARAIDTKNNAGYRSAVETIAHIRGLMIAAGRPEAFGPYVTKRNLMKLLDQQAW